jgi:hypothetical protein
LNNRVVYYFSIELRAFHMMLDEGIVGEHDVVLPGVRSCTSFRVSYPWMG